MPVVDDYPIEDGAEVEEVETERIRSIDGTERTIEVGRRRYRAAPQRPWPWKISQKGNPYTKVGPNHLVVFTSGPDRPGFKFMVNGQVPDRSVYDSVESAKEAAMRYVNVPVPTDLTSASDPSALRKKPDLKPGKRRIEL